MIPLPEGTFRTFYGDPAWQYESKKTGGSMTSGAEQKYPTMTLDEIAALPVKDHIDKKGSVLFLWVPVPLKIDIARSDILESWGFEDYKTTIFWRKIMSAGLGHWFRGQVEECWLCTHGNIKPFGFQIPNFIQTRVGQHSKKPKEMRAIIDEAARKFNLNPKIELFSRDRIETWQVWGNQIPDDEQKMLKEVY